MSFEEILADCLEAIERGETVEACLAQYPQQAAELAPLLRLAVELRDMPPPSLSDVAFQRGRQQLLEAAHARQVAGHHNAELLPEALLAPATPAPVLGKSQDLGSNGRRARRATSRWPRWCLPLVAASLILGLLFLASQANASLPGSSLYGLKLQVEAAQGLLMAAAGEEAAWHMVLANRRLQEALTLQRQARPIPATLLREMEREAQAALDAAASLPQAER
ncbi:hypothetical protein RY27_08335, partial [Litorilinea aerophila]